MTIESMKVNYNRDPNRKCNECGKNIEIGIPFYIEKNDVPNTPLDKLGFSICEDCHNKSKPTSG